MRRAVPLFSATSGPFVSIRALDTRHFVSIIRSFVLSDVREKTKRKRWPSPSGEMTSIRPACTPLSVTQIEKLQAHDLCMCARMCIYTCRCARRFVSCAESMYRYRETSVAWTSNPVEINTVTLPPRKINRFSFYRKISSY